MPATIAIADTVPVRIVTEEVAKFLEAIGEAPWSYNTFTWPAGASRWAHAKLLLNEVDAKKLLALDLGASLRLSFKDDHRASGPVEINAGEMFQLPHRPIHQSRTEDVLWEVPLVDERYFWKFIQTDSSVNVTTTDDRSKFYDVTQKAGPVDQTWGDLIDNLLDRLGIKAQTNVNITPVDADAGVPNDFLMFDEPAAVMLDRVLSSLAAVFTASWDDTFPGNKRYQIADYSSFPNTPVSVRGADLTSGGEANRSDSTEISKRWIDATMPATVAVLFPREIPTSEGDTEANANSPPLQQFLAVTSQAGKPAGVDGRGLTIVKIHDNLWARGPIGSETNAAQLTDRADYLATRFYERFKMPQGAAVLRGFQPFTIGFGETRWSLSVRGAFTTYDIPSDWYGLGGDADVGEGFLDKRVVGLGNVQVWKNWAGSLFISSTGAKQNLFAVQVAVNALANIGVPVIGTSPVACTPPLCGPADVLPKIVCSVPTPVDYVAWRLCDTPDNDNKLGTTTPIDRPEPNPYQTAVGQWSDGSEAIQTWNTKNVSCGTLAVPATFGRGYGYLDCDGAFVLVRVTEERSLEIAFGFGGFIEYLHHIELCEEPTGVFQIVEHFKRLHFQGGIATVDEDKCHRIAIGADKCP